MTREANEFGRGAAAQCSGENFAGTAKVLVCLCRTTLSWRGGGHWPGFIAWARFVSRSPMFLSAQTWTHWLSAPMSVKPAEGIGETTRRSLMRGVQAALPLGMPPGLV